MRYYRGAQIADPASGRPAPRLHHQPHRLHGRGRLRVEPGRQHRPGRVGSADGTGPAVGHGAGRPRRPRYAAAGGRHAAVRPRAFRSRSIRSRPAWASPATWWATISPAATPCCASRASRCGRSASGWKWPAAAPPGKDCAILAGGRPVGASHQRKLLAHARQSRSPWATSPRSCPAGHRTSNRHPRPRRAGPRRRTAILSPQ